MAESEWVTHPGYKSKTIKTKNATIEIICPDITPEENARVEVRVIEAMKALGKELKK